jgi:cytochrome c oxidase subunit 2
MIANNDIILKEIINTFLLKSEYFLVKILTVLSNIVLQSNSMVSCEASSNWQIMFQDPATPIMEGLIILHNDVIILLVAIGAFVTYLLFRTVILFKSSVNPVSDHVTHGTQLEIIWTTLPAVLLIIIAAPSFALLYAVDESISPSLTFKAVGHQWYWSYEYSDYVKNGTRIEFDSYIIPSSDLTPGSYRLLEVDNRVVLPVNIHVRTLITAADVLHSWAVPSLGVKLDACPGRINQTSLFIKREGVFYGQCSEICGENHGFMPIAVEAVNLKDYAEWVYNTLVDLDEDE